MLLPVPADAPLTEGGALTVHANVAVDTDEVS